MSDKFFVDTNILIYAHDAAKGAKHERALVLMESLWDSRTGVLSTQVLQEFCVSLRRKVHPALSAEEVRLRVRNYLNWEIIVNTGESVLGALEIEARDQISFWDALIIHAAQSSGAAVLYSEDLNAGQVYGSVRVVNPLTD
jgi:predicted nucleic acid-binding protein